MSKRPLSVIFKHLASKKNAIGSRPKLTQLVKRDPDSLEAKLATNPYAAILASPLRRCTYHSRMFPSKLLLRFGIAWHPETNDSWAFPTPQKTNGFGYYVKLNRKALDILVKGAYKMAFRGAASFRPDMPQHIHNSLLDTSFKQFNKLHQSSFIPLSSVGSKQWSSTSPSSSGYQCILAFDSKLDVLCDLDHHIEGIEQSIPCYNMNELWTEQHIKTVKDKYSVPHNAPLVIAVSKSASTVQLAVDLWRYKQFIGNK